MINAGECRERWNTPGMRAVRDALIAAWRKRDSEWPRLLPEHMQAKSLEEKEDVRGINLDNIDLAEADLSYSDLSWATCRNCRMRSTILQGVIALEADFSCSSMGGADLLEISAQGAKFVGSDLASAIMIGGNFKNATFRSASLRSAILDNADFQGADLWMCDFRHVETYDTLFDEAGIIQFGICFESTKSHSDSILSPTLQSLFSQYSTWDEVFNKKKNRLRSEVTDKKYPRIASANTLIFGSRSEALTYSMSLGGEYSSRKIGSLIKAIGKNFEDAVGQSLASVVFADAEGTLNIVLTSAGNEKLNVIKAVREITGLGLKEAKALVEAAPTSLKYRVGKEEAEHIKRILETVGAKIELK